MCRGKLSFVGLAVLGLCITTLAAVPAAAMDVGSDAGDQQALVARDLGTGRVYVDCDRGKTITSSLEKKPNKGKLELYIQGTCQEVVFLQRDGVTITSTKPGTTLIGGIQVAHSAGVTISGFTIRDNDATIESAIEAIEGSSITIENMEFLNIINRAIRIRDSVATIRNVHIDTTGTVGILARGSHITFDGDIVSDNSFQAGIVLTGSSNAFNKTGNISASGSPFGIIVQEASSFEAVFGPVAANNNLAVGISVAGNSSFSYGFANLEANNNASFGLFIDEGSKFATFAGFFPETRLEGNGVAGVLIQKESQLAFAGPTFITDSPFGLFSDASYVTLAATSFSNIANADVVLQFGSQGTFGDGNSIATLVCDPSVLSRGSTTCP